MISTIRMGVSSKTVQTSVKAVTQYPICMKVCGIKNQ